MSNNDKSKIDTVEWSGLDQLNTVGGVVHVVRATYSEKLFFSSAWIWYRF